MIEYYKTKAEVAYEYGVAESTVRKWINKSKEKKLNLELISVKNRNYIINNEHNRSVMRNQVEQYRHFRTSDLKSEVKVKNELYNILNKRQLLSLISTIQISKSIPIKYSYLGKGAKYWDNQYASKAYSGRAGNSNIYFLDTLYKYITDHYQDSKLNIIDVGAGNSEPTIPLVQRLIEEGKLNIYAAIDISDTMLKISRKHLLEAGVAESYLSQYKLDYEQISMQDILFEVKDSGSDELEIPNFILMLDSSLGNINTPANVLQNVQSGMFPDDFLCISSAYDNVKTRGIFQEYESRDNHLRKLYIPQLLGLSEEEYEKEMIYNDKLNRKEYNLVMKKDVSIYFEKINKTISLFIGERLNLWSYQRDTFFSISQKAEQANLKLRLIARNPKASSIIYMLGLE